MAGGCGHLPVIPRQVISEQGSWPDELEKSFGSGRPSPDTEGGASSRETPDTRVRTHEKLWILRRLRWLTRTIPAFWRLRQEDCCKPEVSLCYRGASKTAGLHKGSPVSNKTIKYINFKKSLY